MNRILSIRLFALALILAAPSLAAAQGSVEWGKVPGEELFAPHFPEAPYAEAVVLFDHAIARVDKKDRLKYHRHYRAKIFKEGALDRGVVRIPYGPDDEIKNFRAQTIVPPGHLVEVRKDHRRVEKTPFGEVLVVEFPSVAPGVVIEYQYELRRDELHTIEPWSFRGRDFARVSRFELMIPEGMSYDATFSWVPGLTPRPQIRMINDPDDPSRELKQVAWELRDQPAATDVPLAGNPERYRMTLYPQLGEFTSTYKNFQVRRSWGDVGDEVAAQHAAFAKDDGGVSEWVKAASLGGSGRSMAEALHRLVCAGIKLDPDGPGVRTSSLREVVEKKAATPAAKNLLLAHLLREQGIPADVVMVRHADHGPMQPKYRNADQFDHAIVRLQLDGQTVWTDAGTPCCPFGLLPPRAQVTSGLLVAAGGASDLVDVPAIRVKSGRGVTTEASFDKNGTLLATSTLTFEGWEALGPRAAAAKDGGRTLAESIVSERFGGAATLDSFTVASLEDPAEPLVVSVTYRVPDYAHKSSGKMTLKVPYLEAMQANPLAAGDREHPVRLGFAGTRKEKVNLSLPEGYGLPAAPARGNARTADIRFKVDHKMNGTALSSTRTVKVIEPVVTHDSADDLHGVFEKIVAMDTSELVLEQGVRTSSAR